jgi:Fic family protein
MFNSWTPGCEGPLQSLSEQYAHLESLKAKLDRARPLPPATLKSIQDDFQLSYTYNSNAIEGNTLTLYETMVVLKDGFTVGGKSMCEHLEAINHRDAIYLLEQMAQSPEAANEKEVRALHALVLRGIDDLNAGAWRHDTVRIYGASHIPPRAEKIPAKMGEFFDWCHEKASALPPIERAARMHIDFVAIHPFIDGNGRTARLLMNLELLKAAYPIAIIKVEERQKYYQNLDTAISHGDYAPFVRQICEAVERSFEAYFQVI